MDKNKKAVRKTTLPDGVNKPEPSQRLARRITFEDAARHLRSGITLAGFLGKAPNLVEHVCRCVARLGEAQVALLVQEAVASTEDAPEKRVDRFFELYTKKRCALLPPPVSINEESAE